MIANQPISQLLKRLWWHINLRRRKQFGLLLVLMLLASIAEMLSIGSVLPFLAVLTGPERIFEMKASQPFIQLLKLTEPKQLLLPISIAFGAAALITGSMRLLLLWVTTRLSFATGADLSISIYQRTLYQSYTVHCSRNSSEVINGISLNSNSIINGIITPILTLMSSMFMLTAILFTLLILDPLVAILSFGGFGIIYGSIIGMTRRQLLINSQSVARQSTRVIKIMQEGLGGIRDVLIDGTQASYCKVFSDADSILRRANGSNIFISSSPRYAIEAVGMLLIAVFAYSLAQQDGGMARAIPTLGVLVLGAQRLLSLLQVCYASLAHIQAGQAPLQDALELLDQPLPDYSEQSAMQSLTFKNDIKFKQLCFRYSPQAPYVLEQLDLTIVKGSRVGFIGSTGSGKSTLLDIVMGLLQPTNGTLEIDGKVITLANNRAWQAHIAHVPQAIFLTDGTVEENIAFGIPNDQIDRDRVRQAAHQAQIAESIEGWPKQYQTFVGERGIRLSGGQRQRIGIARALYKQADVIIFDEATSALDNETEQAVMQAIEGLSKDLTLLIIAHRRTTLKNCTQIVELGSGGIKRLGTYQEIVNQSGRTIKRKKESL
jgi:ABC-type multidrug transport system fused ATPase/permease subunit